MFKGILIKQIPATLLVTLSIKTELGHWEKLRKNPRAEDPEVFKVVGCLGLYHLIPDQVGNTK